MGQKEYIVNSVVEFEEYAKSGVDIIKIKQSVLMKVQFGFDDIASKYGYECIVSPSDSSQNLKDNQPSDPSETVEEPVLVYKKLASSH